MQRVRKLLMVICVSLLASCACQRADTQAYNDVYVADFHSEDIAGCKPSDVDLSHSQTADFFKRAKQIDYKILHDHYNHAPCYIEGTLKAEGNSCDWQIRAGATGQVQCGTEPTYYACDDCGDLFE